MCELVGGPRDGDVKPLAEPTAAFYERAYLVSIYTRDDATGRYHYVETVSVRDWMRRCM